MTTPEIKKLLLTNEYDFLRENPHLGKNICLLTLGGSHAYGTNIEGSDVDIRGVAVNSRSEILLGRDFEQVVNPDLDVTIYSFKKIINLLSNLNPNTIELLGNRDEDYLYVSEPGKIILENKNIFLSKRCIASFGGYANQQLRRLSNKSARLVSQAEKEEHIKNSIKCASYFFRDKYFEHPDDAIKLYLDKSTRPDMDQEIFMDLDLKHYPLRDYKSMWAEMNNIVKDYDKLGHRNANAIEKGKLSKHMMHLIRLYYMCFDILEKGEIITYRKEEHDFLMSVRSGKYLDNDRQPTKEFLDMVDELENKLQKLAQTTELPDLPDREKIDKLVEDVHESIICST
jgi:predicted nucleotidyltransferase